MKSLVSVVFHTGDLDMTTVRNIHKEALDDLTVRNTSFGFTAFECDKLTSGKLCPKVAKEMLDVIRKLNDPAVRLWFPINLSEKDAEIVKEIKALFAEEFKPKEKE